MPENKKDKINSLDIQIGGDHYKDKNGMEDLEKAKHLIDILIENFLKGRG